MEKEHIQYDINDYRKLQSNMHSLDLQWIVTWNAWDGCGKQKIKSGIDTHDFIRCFTLNNLNLRNIPFCTNIENKEFQKEIFERYVYYRLYLLCNEYPTKSKRPQKRESTTLIIDEYGIDKYASKYEGINLLKLTSRQLKTRCGVIANIFASNTTANYYVPEKYKKLHIGSVLRIRKGVKLFSKVENENLYDFGIGNVNCKPDKDEEIYFKLTNYDVTIEERKLLWGYREICPYIDFGNLNVNLSSTRTAYAKTTQGINGYDPKENPYIFFEYKAYEQKEGSKFFNSHYPNINLSWYITIRSSEVERRVIEVINQSEEMERKKRELEWLEERRTEEERLAKFRYNKRNRHSRDYYISFDEAKHTYTVDGKILQSVTHIVENCFPKFDAELHAKYTAAKMGITPEKVIMMWEQKGKESRELGTAMHQKIESYYQGKDSREDDSYRLFKMFAEKKELVPYRTEWAVYDTDHNIAGTIDFVDYQNGEYTIYDWKRSDKIIANGMPVKVSKYQEKGLYPLEHLENCAYYHYALQLSLYKFILERNYNMKISKLRLGIFHPTYDKPYVLEVPYLENEVNTLMGLRSEIIF